MTKYKYLTTTQFRKDVKLCLKQGRLAGLWECHIQSDWLLIWDQDDNKLTMIMTRTGSHSLLLNM